MIISFIPKTYAMDITLEEVIKRFNESTIVNNLQYATYDKGNVLTGNNNKKKQK